MSLQSFFLQNQSLR